MAEVNKCSLENMLSAILGVANAEQNQAFPATIFSSQYNTVTSLLLDKLADIYPSDTTVVDMLEPFVIRTVKRPVNGIIKLPDDYRNLLGTPQISAKDDGCAECEQENFVSDQEFNQLKLKSGCKKVPLVIIDQAEFAYRTTSTYKQPTFKNPVGYFSGQREIKVCPYNINAVELMYVKKEPLFVYGYTMQPDDTFVFNKDKSVESLWQSNAFTPIFNMLFSLYCAYSRDNQLKDWALYLNENKLI